MVLAIRTEKRHAEYGFVDYYDKKTYSGDLNLFHRPKEFAYGQVTITGQVFLKEEGTPIPGANVREKGTMNGPTANQF